MENTISYQILNQGKKPLRNEMWFIEKVFPVLKDEIILVCQESGLLEKGELYSFTDYVWYIILGELRGFNLKKEVLLELKKWLYTPVSFTEDAIPENIAEKLFPYVDDNFELATSERIKAKEYCSDRTELVNSINALGFTHLSFVIGLCLVQRKDINLVITSKGGFTLVDANTKTVCYSNNNFDDEPILATCNLSIQLIIGSFLEPEERTDYFNLPKAQSEEKEAILDLVLKFLYTSNEIVISNNTQTNKINVNISKLRKIIDKSELGMVIEDLSIRDHREIRLDTQKKKIIVSHKDKYTFDKTEKTKN